MSHTLDHNSLIKNEIIDLNEEKIKKFVFTEIEIWLSRMSDNKTKESFIDQSIYNVFVCIDKRSNHIAADSSHDYRLIDVSDRGGLF